MRKHILVVEDDVALARVIKDNLVAVGFDVELSRNGRLAVDAIRARTPDLVVLDVMLPGPGRLRVVHDAAPGRTNAGRVSHCAGPAGGQAPRAQRRG